MKQKKLLKILFAVLMTAITACTVPADQTVKPSESNEVIVIIDATDELHKEANVPIATGAFFDQIIAKILKAGGILRVTYIDSNSGNNQIAFLKIPRQIHYDVREKTDYETPKEYDKLKQEIEDKKKVQEEDFILRLSIFKEELKQVMTSAYTPALAREKKGSDIHGALNICGRIFASSPSDTKKWILCISDGLDNVGKTLNPISGAIVLVVGSIGANSPLIKFAKEFDNLEVATDYIFNN